MKKLIVVFCVAFVPVPVLAHWLPADGHKMHYPQLPDEEGWDVNATFPVVLADDWQCSQSGLVEDIHFWGSWRDVDAVPDGVGNVGVIESFHVRIYANVPADPPSEPWSRPGELLWERVIEISGVGVNGPIDPGAMEGWYDPSTGVFIENDHDAYFQYNIVDISDPHKQMEGEIYWLSITANVAAVPLPDPQPVWGWKSSVSPQFMDDAVWGEDPTYIWEEMYEPPAPPSTQSLDLAFVITGPAIPAVSAWGLLVMLLLVVAAGTIVIRRRRTVAA